MALNDSLNALFIRYDRHMKNRQAVLQGGGEQHGESEQTTELVTIPTTSVNAVVITLCIFCTGLTVAVIGVSFN